LVEEAKGGPSKLLLSFLSLCAMSILFQIEAHINELTLNCLNCAIILSANTLSSGTNVASTCINDYIDVIITINLLADAQVTYCNEQQLLCG
jgi:hypothetical protein